MIRLRTVENCRVGFIILLQICRIIHSVEGINCYYCAWIDSTEGYELHSLRERKDICRPQNFDPATVHTEKCRNGCITMILHEAATVLGNVSVKNCSSLEVTLNSFVLTKAGGEPGPATRADVDLFPPLPITFFYRGCPNNHTTKLANGCEFVKFRSGCQQRTCYCTTELCNGEVVKSTASEGSRRWSSQKAILIVFRMVFIVTMR